MSVSDRDVVGDVRRGDRDAFGTIVERYQGRLFALALMIVRRPAAAEDVTQDAFVRAYEHLDQYDEAQPFYPWLATIAVRLAQNWWRRQSRTVQREGAAVEEALEPGDTATQLIGVIADERNRNLWHAVATLPAAERTAATLYYRDEMPIRDIAHALGVTTGTIKTLLFRARRRLRERLHATVIPGEERST